jgi:hypothetical protein
MREEQQHKVRQSPKDKDGNFFKAYQSSHSIVIKLCLHNERREREIGVVNIKERTLSIRRLRSKHLLKKSNSYGFNEHVLSTATTFDNVILSDEYETWSIPREFVINNGKYLFFKGQGFERQVFLAIEKIELYKTKKLF